MLYLPAMETVKIDFIQGGTVTSPAGFRAGGTSAGIKKSGALDLGVLYSEVESVAAGVFTTSRIKSAPVLLCQERLAAGKAVAIVANSGCANAYTGEQGMIDAKAMAKKVAICIASRPEEVLVASTGVTGKPLPMNLIRPGIIQLVLTVAGGHDLARAIMTTDTKPKEVAVAVRFGGVSFTIGGIAKGSGMIHPNMATMFGFLTTDAKVGLEFLRGAIRRAADVTFNMISVDGDMSPSDTVIIMANGLAKNQVITDEDSPLAEVFELALTQVCLYLAKSIARDGEGATRLIEATVEGAVTISDARVAARSIVGSSLVKTAVYGGDPNWGRIVAAVGRSGAEVKESNIDVEIGQVKVLKSGRPLDYDEADVIAVFRESEVPIKVNLNLGEESATAWGCDLTPEYVKINSEYMT
jgi:glutamate N-acetyltransferase/amino-acid N-acetyltransferase